MKFQVICRNDGSVEVHSRTCREVTWENYYSDGVVEAESAFAAAVDVLGGDEREACDALLFPCLAPDYEAPETPRRPRRPTRRAVPFDPDESADPEVIGACYGKRVTWVSEISGQEEYGVLYPEGPYDKILDKGRVITTYPHNYTTITVSTAGRRVLNFLHRGDRGTDTQFRAVALETIVSVK